MVSHSNLLEISKKEAHALNCHVQPPVSPCVLCVSSLGSSPPFRSTAVLEQSLKRWQGCHAPSPLTCPSICHHPAPQPSFLWKFYLAEQMAPPTPISNARAPIPCSWYGCLHVNFYSADLNSLISIKMFSYILEFWNTFKGIFCMGNVLDWFPRP